MATKAELSASKNAKQGEKSAREYDRNIINGKIERLETAVKKLGEINGRAGVCHAGFCGKSGDFHDWKGRKHCSHTEVLSCMESGCKEYRDAAGEKIEEINREITRLKNESGHLSNITSSLANAISGLINAITRAAE